MVRLCEDSPLRNADARVKLLLTFLIAAAVILPLHRLLLFACGFVLLLGYARLLREASHQVRRILWLLVALFCLDWAFIGLDFAVLITVRLLIMVSASALLLGTTTPEEFRQALRSLGVPHRYSFALSLAFQSIPLAHGRWRIIQEAQRARGAVVERNGWRELPAQLRDLLALAVPAVVLTTQRAWTLTEAAHARGFGAPRGSLAPRLGVRSVHWRDWALVAGTLACLMVLGLYP